MMLKDNDFKMKIMLVMLAFCMVLTLVSVIDSPARVNANQSASSAAAGSAEDPLITLSYLNNSVAYTVVELRRGQRLRSKTNAVEVILRPGGEASVISPHTSIGLGLADLTAGTELLNGDNMPRNHIILIPRPDGRAVTATSDIAYIMVRGDYEIY